MYINILFILNCLGPPAAPALEQTFQEMASLTCDADQESLVVNLSWEVPSDANCTSCTVISMTTGQTRNQLVCNRTTVAFELNCSETYNISLTAVNDCGLQSDQTSVEITLGMYMYNTHTIHIVAGI